MRWRQSSTPFWGRRASPTELSALKRDLRRWRSVEGFERILRRFRARIRDHGIDQPGSCFREAHTALTCAQRLPAELVRLGADPPDFELSMGGEVVCCEAVEVQAPGRRRGDELKADRSLSAARRGAPRLLGEAAFIPAAAALRQVATEVGKKAAKSYAAGTVLCIYENIGFIDEERVFMHGLSEALAPGFATFAAIWVLRDAQLLKFEAGEVTGVC